MPFSSFGLSPKVIEAIQAAGYTEPTEIQTHAIPPALAGKDVLGIAQTGTGKTAAFTLPMLTRLERGRARARMPRSLVLEPTRELAAQVAEALEVYGAKHKLTVVLLIGGVSFADQDKKLDRGADIVIATPGRLLDHFERGKLMLSGVEIMVVDEADRMLDMGFIPDIERIFKLTPFTRQTLFFSATMPSEIERLTNTFLQAPVRIEVARQATTAATIEQHLVAAPGDTKGKRARFRDLLRALDVKNAIIFCNRKRDVAILERSLVRHGFDAGALHGDMDQHSRTQMLDRFRRGDVTLLVASDVAARGLDIPAVSHIFNFDVPVHSEDYVHRIGRTGRAGLRGEAYSLVTPTDRKQVKAIEALIGKDISWLDAAQAPEEEPATARGEPAKRSRGERRAGGNGRPPARRSRERPARPEPARPEPARPEPDRSAAPTRRREEEETGAFAESAFVPDFLLRPVKTSADV